LWALLPAFQLLAVYGALSGITQELVGYGGFNIAGFPHQEAFGLGSWIVFGLLLVAMIVSFWERRSKTYLLGAVALLAGIIPLLAGQFETQIATATAWRWLAAMFLLLGSIAIWARRKISERWDEGFVEEVRTLLFGLTILPLLILTSYAALRTIFYLPLQGPSNGFIYGVPLSVAGLVLIGHAVRERMPSFALFAGAFFNATITVAFLLAVASVQGSMDRIVLIRLVQLNVITLGVYLLPWLSTRRRWQSALDQRGEGVVDYLFKLQLLLATSLSAALFLPALLIIVLFPDQAGSGIAAIGSSLGWLSLASITVAAIWLIRRISPWALACLLFAVSCLVAFNFAAISGWALVRLLRTPATQSTAGRR